VRPPAPSGCAAPRDVPLCLLSSSPRFYLHRILAPERSSTLRGSSAFLRSRPLKAPSSHAPPSQEADGITQQVLDELGLSMGAALPAGPLRSLARPPARPVPSAPRPPLRA
jgi:hypothetical protein